MATEAIKDSVITNLDATPPVRATGGMGGPQKLFCADGQCAIASGVTTGSTYQLVRLPSNAIVKRVEVWLDAASTTITGNVGLLYSTSTRDGTAKANQGTAIRASHFAAAYAAAAIVTPTDVTFSGGDFVFADTRKELWNTTSMGLGTTGDPGGFFDVTWTSTATAGAAAVLNCRVFYTQPGM